MSSAGFALIFVQSQTGQDFPSTISTQEVIEYFELSLSIELGDHVANDSTRSIWKFVYHSDLNELQFIEPEDKIKGIAINITVVTKFVDVIFSTVSGDPIEDLLTVEDVLDGLYNYEIELETIPENNLTRSQWIFKYAGDEAKACSICTVYDLGKTKFQYGLSLPSRKTIFELRFEANNGAVDIAAIKANEANFLKAIKLRGIEDAVLRADGKFECDPAHYHGDDRFVVQRVKYLIVQCNAGNAAATSANNVVQTPTVPATTIPAVAAPIPAVPIQNVPSKLPEVQVFPAVPYNPTIPALSGLGGHVLPPPAPVESNRSPDIQTLNANVNTMNISVETAHSTQKSTIPVVNLNLPNIPTPSPLQRAPSNGGISADTKGKIFVGKPNKTINIIPHSGSLGDAEFGKGSVIDILSADAIENRLKKMPECAEHTLWSLYYLFQHNSTNVNGLIGSGELNFVFSKLNSQLEKERIMNSVIKQNVSLMQDYLASSNFEKAANCVQLCIKEIEVIDTNLLVNLLSQTRKTAGRIADKDIVLLLGNTGAGKSTTIHFLAGSRFQLVLEGGQDHMKVVESVPELQSFTTSSKLESETFYINAIDFEVNGKRFTLCDTPGFEDNRGVEIDIANGIGMANAVRGSRTVRPVILISRSSAGDRFDTAVKVLKVPIELISPIKPYLPTLNYWFTKYPKEFSKPERLYATITEKRNLVQKKENGETLEILNDILLKLESNGYIAPVIDPLNDDPVKMIEKLLDSPCIAQPNEVFQNFTTSENCNKLKVQLGKHFASIDVGLEQEEYPLVAYKLSQLKVLCDCLQLEDCKNLYNDSVKKVLVESSKMLTRVFERMGNCAIDANRSIENDIESCAKDISKLYKIEAVRAEHFPEEPQYPESCSCLLLRTQKDLSLVVEKLGESNLEESERDNVMEQSHINLHKMRVISEVFGNLVISDFSSQETDSYNIHGLTDTLNAIYRHSSSTIKGNFVHLRDQLNQRLKAFDILHALSLYDQLHDYCKLFEVHLLFENSEFNPQEILSRLNKSILESVSSAKDRIIHHLDAASDGNQVLTKDDVNLIQRNFTELHDLNDSTLFETHFGALAAASFTDVVERVRNFFEQIN